MPRVVHHDYGRAFAHIAATTHGKSARDGKAWSILAAVMSAMMVFMVTLLVTVLNLGMRPDFPLQSAKACIIAWPIATTTAFLVMPSARRATDGIMRLIGNRSREKSLHTKTR